MPVTIIKETIELNDILLDDVGNAFIQKRINLQTGYRHMLQQVDVFEDAIPFLRGAPGDEQPNYEIVISPYPQIPTEMRYNENTPQENRYVSGGDDSVLFKANARVRLNNHSEFTQFPSAQIAAVNKSFFYSDHLYINIHFMGIAGLVYGNIALSFMMVLNNVKVSSTESTIGILAESHDAMCALIMSNGHMVSQQVLRGNVFPMWRYGGIRPENMITPTAANAYFLPINTRDAEAMTTTPGIRQAVADSRAMSAFDAAFGDRRPDWLRMHLNAGVVAGAVRDQWPPIKHADNGNVRML